MFYGSLKTVSTITRYHRKESRLEYIITFLEGIITFLSPCLLPMLPLYLTYIAGRPSERTKNGTLYSALGFIAGFSITFISLGVFAGTLGRFIIRYGQWINIVSGSIIIFFGLSYLGVFRIKLFNGAANLKSNPKSRGFFPSVLLGIIFSVGWTPCVGTFLGSALVMAAQSGSAMKGFFMLSAYTLGLGIPFLISALLINQLKSTFDFIKKHYKIINILSGILLILIGLLMITGIYGRLLSALSFS